ncbi:MAG: TRAP transporter large permease [Spirochaetia bacterium]|nr:TRAP transporter large permease [Spirochaetia bacterium]
MMLIVIFAVLLLLILLGSPILLVLGIVSLGGILYTPDLVVALFPQKMFTSIDSFSLLAMPFFILAGGLMSQGGISKRLVQFAETTVGHTRGGLAQANIVSSMVFSGVSGSSTADTAAVGSILIPSMVEKGYKPGYAAAITATSSTIGPIIPPSMTMIIYGSMAGVSIGGLFLAGIIPGILIGIGLMIAVFIQSFSPSFPELRAREGSFQIREVLRSTRQVWTALLAPVIILGGIVSGIFTATEAGVVTVYYALFTTFVIYRSFTWRDLPKIILESALTTAQVVGIIAVAGALGWLLSYMNFNVMVLHLLTSISTIPIVVFLMMLGIMMILTMFVESLAILIIFIPVAVYVTSTFGIDPLHAGLCIVMATQIGAVTPPVAVLLFVATSIANTTFDQTVKYVWPFLLTLQLVLLLVVFFPAVATFIPRVLVGF